MSHLLFWPSITYFYPVGNTSAVYLTEDLSPESKADVLLLACGDPRHILYTIYVEEASPLTRARPFDIVCCDVDIAILARNALLFTLLVNETTLDKLDSIWNLFYHMLVDQTSLLILFEQCRKLVALAESVESWRAGPYGHFLTTCDAATLAGLRRMWTAYLAPASFSSEQADQFKWSFIRGMEEMSQRRRAGTTAARSAGPLAPHAQQAILHPFRRYWSSGTIDGDDDGQSQVQRRRLRVNPTFAFSLDGDEFAVHYAADPLCGFHLAEAFVLGNSTRPREFAQSHEVVRVAKDQFSRWCTSVGKRLKDDNPSSPTFVVRMFAGDVLRFCQALKYCEMMRSTVTPYTVAAWRLSTITLDDRFYGPGAATPAPLSFNVIDTSNISDHVGLVNLLIVTAPLLRMAPSAVLYTEVLHRKGDNSSQADLEHICGDLPAMALLLGMVPSTFVSQFTTRSNAYASLSVNEAEIPYHERLAWKAIGFGGRVDCHSDGDLALPQSLSLLPEHLANFLFHVYLQMFSDEDMESRFQQLPFFSLASFLQTSRRPGILHYTRRSFALLVHLAKTRVQTDWHRTMVLFEKLVTTDTRLLVGQHAYQELCCHLHLLGIYTAPWMTAPALRRLRIEYEGGSEGVSMPGMFCDWQCTDDTGIPPVVTLALVVPRNAIVLLEYEFGRVGTPMMQCDVQDGPRVNCFGVTSATFGSLRVSGTGEHRTAVVVEGGADAADVGGTAVPGMQPPWRSQAPLIITFAIPSSSVMDFGRNPEATVGLVLRATPNVSRLMDRLGPDLTVFRTQLRNAERVFVLAQAPVVGTSANTCSDGEARGLRIAAAADHWHENAREDLSSEQAGGNLDAPQETNAGVHVQMNETFNAVQSFTIRIDVTNPDAQATLGKRKTIPTVHSCSGSTRSLDACVKIGKHTFNLRFPLPVDTAHTKLRVARKSSYVEVVAPLVPLDGRPEHNITNWFAQMILDPDDDSTPTLGSIHRLKLDRCPSFKLPKDQSESDWLDSHLRLMFSELEEERALLSQLESLDTDSIPSEPAQMGTLLHVKQTLRVLLRSAADATRDGKPHGKAFVICDASRRGAPYLFIIIARMCLDVGSHTVVADAFVALGTPSVRAALETAQCNENAVTGTRIPGFGKPDESNAWIERRTTDSGETAAWFHLIPRLTERCRTWSHKASCAYRTAAQQREAEPEQSQVSGAQRRRSSLCMCGQGMGTKTLPKVFERVAPYLTRAAFSPLISVPYLEEMDTEMPWEDDMRRATLHDWPAGIGGGDADTFGMGQRCWTCGKEGGRTCSGCKRARYCSRGCQRADWKSHKRDCR